MPPLTVCEPTGDLPARAGRPSGPTPRTEKPRVLCEEANPAHRLPVEHNRDTLLVHLSGEDGKGWTVLAVDRATRRWAVGQAARQLPPKTLTRSSTPVVERRMTGPAWGHRRARASLAAAPREFARVRFSEPSNRLRIPGRKGNAPVG